MRLATLLSLSGGVAALGGALRVGSAFVPWRAGSPGLEAFYLVIDLALLFGLLGIYLPVASRLGVTGLVGFAAALAGLASIVGPDPVAFGIDHYAAGSAVLAVGLAVLSVALLRGRVLPAWIPALWIAVPVISVAADALGRSDAGFLLAGVVFGAAFVGAGQRTWAAGRALAAEPPAALELNQVTLPALDRAESIDFYRRFGLRLIVDSPENGYARFEIPGGALSIHEMPGQPAEPAPHVYFETPTPEARVAWLRENGIEPAEPLEDKPWLWREAWYVDPAGNRVCVYRAGENRKRPPWRLPAAAGG